MRRTPTHARRVWAAVGAVALATGALAPAAVAVDAAAPGGAPGSWKIDHIGVGSGGSAVLGDDGTLVVDATSTSNKIADSEDGFWYYYTPVDPRSPTGPTEPPSTGGPTTVPPTTVPPTTPPTTVTPTEEPATEPTDDPSSGTPTDDPTDDASDEPTDDGAAGPSDGELPATGVAGGAVAAVLAAVLLTIGAALRSRREQEA